MPDKGASMSLDERAFVKQQYDTSGNLDARVALHARYSVNTYGWFRWVYDRLELRPGDCVLELGCGTGELWARNAARLPDGLRLMLTDLSAGMVERAATALTALPVAAAFAQVDAQRCLIPTVASTWSLRITCSTTCRIERGRWARSRGCWPLAAAFMPRPSAWGTWPNCAR